MKIFLSSLENAQQCKIEGGDDIARILVREGIRFRWNLMSYYYIRPTTNLAEFIRDNSDEVLIDSGAHSFQKGVRVDWEKYTREYAAFIERFDRPNVVGYFEMDVDNIIGYERVRELRKVLDAISGKIIPVWHKSRGVKDFKEMCRRQAGKVVGITGFRNEDIKDGQYLMFVKYAHEHGCRVHCLGMTRRAVLDEVPFDYVDSSTWNAQSRYGRVNSAGGKVCSQGTSRTRRGVIFCENYRHAMRMQEHYYMRWRKECKD